MEENTTQLLNEFGNFNPGHDVAAAAPLLILLAGGLLLMLLDAFKANRALPVAAAAAYVVSSLAAMFMGNAGQMSFHFNESIAFGGLASLIHAFLCVAGLFSIFFVDEYLRRKGKFVGECYALMIFATVGMIMLANANDLVVVFIGLEIMSVSLYVLAGLFPRDVASNEASLKYFLLGAFATGFLLFGISMLYGLSGMVSGAPTTNLTELGQSISIIQDSALFYVAIVLILIGFGFKIAAFPFHAWTPDVYTGAPTPIVGFMGTGSKMAAFIALALFMRHVVPGEDGTVIGFLSLLAIASMVYGNIVAAQQTNIKRILAYSSIAHTGYLILGVASGPEGFMGVVFYMLIYTFMTLGAFGIISMVEDNLADCELENWKEFGLRKPWAGVAMSTFLFSLAGMPPLAGFMGKYFVFAAAINNGLVIPAIIGILTSVVGAFYYLRIIVFMYFYKRETEDAPATFTLPQQTPMIGALLLVAIIILLGVMPYSIIDPLQSFFAEARMFVSN